jgi:hypothetical protein
VSKQHPDFTAASTAERWTGNLGQLFYTLAQEAYQGHGAWRRRVLPHGAWVAMRVKPDDFPRKELVIARSQGPKDAKAEAAWVRELGTFLKHAACSPDGKWLPTEDRRHPGTGAVKQFYVELYPLEVAPGKIRCQGEDCARVLDFTLDGPTRCPECRAKASLDAVQQRIGGAA